MLLSSRRSHGQRAAAGLSRALLPLPGRWHMRIDALVGDFDQISLEDDIDIASP